MNCVLLDFVVPTWSYLEVVKKRDTVKHLLMLVTCTGLWLMNPQKDWTIIYPRSEVNLSSYHRMFGDNYSVYFCSRSSKKQWIEVVESWLVFRLLILKGSYKPP